MIIYLDRLLIQVLSVPFGGQMSASFLMRLEGSALTGRVHPPLSAGIWHKLARPECDPATGEYPGAR